MKTITVHFGSLGFLGVSADAEPPSGLGSLYSDTVSPPCRPRHSLERGNVRTLPTSRMKTKRDEEGQSSPAGPFGKSPNDPSHPE